MYGETRLINLFNRKDYSCLLELHHDLKDDIEKFIDGAEQSDDFTYLTLKFHGDKYLYKEENFDASFDELENMLKFMVKKKIKNQIMKLY